VCSCQWDEARNTKFKEKENASKHEQKVGIVGAVLTAAIVAAALPAYAQGSSGSTLQASKTLDICDNGNGTWTYSGEVSVWNTGVNAASGLTITDCLQDKLASSAKQPANVA